MAEEPIEDGFEGKFFNALLIVLIVVMIALSANALLNRKPEAYSEVYLKPGEVPSIVSFGEKVPVSFFIKNVEGKTASYTYKISAEEKQQAGAVVSLENNELKQISETVEFSIPSPEKQKILVEIYKEGKAEPYTLWFWVKVS